MNIIGHSPESGSTINRSMVDQSTGSWGLNESFTLPKLSRNHYQNAAHRTIDCNKY